MALYMLSVYTPEDEVPRSDEDMQRMQEEIGKVNEELKASGSWVFGGALHGYESASVVRESGGDFMTIDGPFAETKEHIGGFYLIEVEDLDAALEWAKKTTAALGSPIEVWPVRHGETA